ncbi:uncharacterized protein LOC143228942 [Tachypleus tridentatus]|uniref:uncharacterized protein LOC143228942 n=1 Tax=Tachypleus tridentatus TaxID=6853 RepID=UPI003FD2F8A2
MKPGIRGCYGASCAATLTGILVVAAGVIAMVLSIFRSTTVTDHNSWWFLVGVLAAGFLCLTLGFLGCAFGFCCHLAETSNEAAVHPVEDRKILPSQPITPFHTAVAPPPFMYQPPSGHIQAWSPYHQESNNLPPPIQQMAPPAVVET